MRSATYTHECCNVCNSKGLPGVTYTAHPDGPHWLKGWYWFKGQESVYMRVFSGGCRGCAEVGIQRAEVMLLLLAKVGFKPKKIGP